MEPQDNQQTPRPPGRRRKDAAAYLRNVKGVPCTQGWLAKLAVTGDGPPFRYYGRFPIYDNSDLDAFVESRMSKKVHSTSGLGPRDGAHRGRPRSKPEPLTADGQAA